jgi:hypothetical protein
VGFELTATATSIIIQTYHVNGFYVTASENYEDKNSIYNPRILIEAMLMRMTPDSSRKIEIADMRVIDGPKDSIYLVKEVMHDYRKDGTAEESIVIKIYADFSVCSITDIHSLISYVQENFDSLRRKIKYRENFLLWSDLCKQRKLNSISHLDSLELAVFMPKAHLKLVIEKGKYTLYRHLTTSTFKLNRPLFSTSHLKAIYRSSKAMVFVSKFDSLTFYKSLRPSVYGTKNWGVYQYSFYNPLEIDAVEKVRYIVVKSGDNLAVYDSESNTLNDLDRLMKTLVDESRKDSEEVRSYKFFFFSVMIVSGALLAVVLRSIFS